MSTIGQIMQNNLNASSGYVPQNPSANSTTPEPSLNDLLLQQQLEEANYNAMLRPLMLQQMGLVEETDASGNKSLRQMTEDERYALMTDDEKASYDVEKAATAQQLKYSRGEGETPEAINAALAKQRRSEESAMRQRLGAKGSKLSTAGIETASGITGNELGVKSAYAYGNEQQGLGLLGTAAQNLYNTQSNWNSVTQGGLGLTGMGVAANSPFTAQNDLSSLQSSLNDQRKYALAGGLLNAAGSVAGTYLTRGMGGRK